jgi:hypothetical protein
MTDDDGPSDIIALARTAFGWRGRKAMHEQLAPPRSSADMTVRIGR